MSKLIFEKQTPQGVLKIFNDRPTEIDFLEIEQVHGSTILENSSGKKADGIISLKNETKSPLAIKTADCIPLLVLGNKGFGMIHAGWRGVQSKIHTQKEVENIEPTYFFIGPHISSQSYEVTEEFYNYFPNSTHLFNKIDDKTTFNLSEQMKQDLESKFPKAKIEVSNICTFSNLKFNSYRRDRTNLRNWNIFFPL